MEFQPGVWARKILSSGKGNEMIRPLHAIVFLCAPLAALAADAVVNTPSMLVPPGTPVQLRLSQTLSSRESHAADRVDFSVEQDVSVAGAVAISKGSLAWGNVSEASPRGRMSRPGRLSVDIRSVCLADGGSAGLRGTNGNGAGVVRRHDKSDSESALAVPAWPVLIFMLGKDVSIPAGSIVTAYLDAPAYVDATHSAAAPVTNCRGGAQTAAAPEHEGAFVTIRSNPDGAEIRIDGEFAGNTPSHLKLAPGDHRVSLAMAGREPWERRLRIQSGADLTVIAALELATSSAGSRAIGN